MVAFSNARVTRRFGGQSQVLVTGRVTRRCSSPAWLQCARARRVNRCYGGSPWAMNRWASRRVTRRSRGSGWATRYHPDPSSSRPLPPFVKRLLLACVLVLQRFVIPLLFISFAVGISHYRIYAARDSWMSIPMPISGSLLRYFGVGNRSFVYSISCGLVPVLFNLITNTTGTVEWWNQWMHVLLKIVLRGGAGVWRKIFFRGLYDFFVLCIIVYILFQAVFEYVCDFKVAPSLAVPGGVMFLRLWNNFSV